MIAQLLPHLVCFALLNLVIIVLGYWCLKKHQIALSWGLFIISIPLIHFVVLHDHPIFRMLAIIATTFNCMKVIAATLDYKNKPVPLTFMQWLAFAGGWAGMRAQIFEKFASPALPGAGAMIRFGFSRVVLGGLMIFAARYVAHLQLDPHARYIIVSGMLLVGLSLLLHFGILSISAGMWRLSGVNTYLLFKQPATALSLTEFWGKRWNLAFSEMTALTIFRPLRDRIGKGGALMISFVFSGILHELALSVPVNHGYGLPTLYFILHGALVLLEKWLSSKNVHLLKNKFIAHLWVFFWLVIPMPLLFHSHFINEIVRPLVGLRP